MSAWVLVSFRGSQPTSLFTADPAGVIAAISKELPSLITVAYVPAYLEDDK